jgi:hypothetical protein
MADMISIPIVEYKNLLQAQTELRIIYSKSISGEDYNLGSFVSDIRNALHPILNPDHEEDSDAE